MSSPLRSSPLREIRTRRRIRRGEGVRIPWGCRVSCDVEIGDHTRITGSFHARGAGSFLIGRYCAIGHGLHVITSNHDTRRANLQGKLHRRLTGEKLLAAKRDVQIGHNVWIGDNVILLPGAVVGDGAVLGAGAVVSGDIPDFAIAAGNPARLIRYRFSEQIRAGLHDLSWWNWSPERVARNANLFRVDLASMEDEKQLMELVVE